MKIKKINTYILNRRKIPFFVLYLEKTNFEIYTYVKKKKKKKSIDRAARETFRNYKATVHLKNFRQTFYPPS